MLKSFEVSNLYHQYLSSRVHSFLHEHSMQASVCVCVSCRWLSVFIFHYYLFGRLLTALARSLSFQRLSSVILWSLISISFDYSIHTQWQRARERSSEENDTKWNELKWEEKKKQYKNINCIHLFICFGCLFIDIIVHSFWFYRRRAAFIVGLRESAKEA